MARKKTLLEVQPEPTLPQPDGGVHVARIMTPDPIIFPPKLRLVIEHYLDIWPRDKKAAALKGGMEPAEFERHFHSPGVFQYIQKQEEAIDEAKAQLRAKARVLTEDHLDAALVGILAENAEGTTSARVKAVEVGYKRFGMLIEKKELTGGKGAPLAFELVRLGPPKKAGNSASPSISPADL
jgi:hypothetical protein